MGLSDVLTAYRAALSRAGFTLVPKGSSIRDVAALNKKVFSLNVDTGLVVEDSQGQGLPHYVAGIKLEVHWNPEIDESLTSNTIAADLESIYGVMLKDSNRSAETMKVTAVTPGRVDDSKSNDTKWLGVFRVDYRIAQDMT